MTLDVQKVAPRAIGFGLGTLAWYAMPDVIRSRPLRVLAKAGLSAALVAGIAATDDGQITTALGESLDTLTDQVWGTKKAMAVGAGAALALVGTIAVTVIGEHAIYQRGERRRAEGVRAAHTRQGLVMGVLGVAAGVY